MSTISTPRSFRSFAPWTSFSTVWPRGGSSSTVTTNSPASSLRWKVVGARSRRSPTVSPAVGARTVMVGRGVSRAAGRFRSRASRIAAMCCGVVPQQPPTTRAPASTMRAAYSAMYVGDER